jgi:hypothetical protein
MRKPYRAQLVSSQKETHSLLQSMAERDALWDVCVVTIDLNRMHRLVSNNHWWKFVERFELVRFVLKLIPGFADLQIRLTSGRRLMNGENDRFQVEWHSRTRPPSLRSFKELDRPCV